MNTDLNKSAHCYVGLFEGVPVCFFAVLHFPHADVKNFKRGHRLVVLPDYQGLGIGHEFSSQIAQKYINDGFRFVITSSTKSLFIQRKKDPRWIITSKTRAHKSKTSMESIKKSISSSKITFSYEYVGLKNG